MNVYGRSIVGLSNKESWFQIIFHTLSLFMVEFSGVLKRESAIKIIQGTSLISERQSVIQQILSHHILSLCLFLCNVLTDCFI